MIDTAAGAVRLMPAADPVERAIQAFGRRLEAHGRSPNTVSAYLRDLRTLARVLTSIHPELTIDQVTPTMLDKVLTDPTVSEKTGGAPRSAASLHRFKAAVRSFFAWAEEAELVPENPARSVTMRRLPRTLPVFLTETEKRRLLKELRGRSSTLARRDRVIVELFLGTGIRLQELVSLDIDDVDLDAKHLRIRAKGNVPQVRFLKSNLRSLLRRYLAERRKHGTANAALFPSNRGARVSSRQVANRVKFWLAEAGIEKSFGPHGLRHSFATHLYAATSDLLVVKRALGHRDISTTEIYTHLVDGALEEALERL